MHIVFASDNGFIRQLLVSSGSAAFATRQGGRPLCVHVLDCGMDEDSWAWYARQMERLAERHCLHIALRRHVIDMARFAHLPGWTNGSKATWARILIPELLESMDVCVYSDCDMLFVADPADMESAAPGDILLAGHRNPFGECGPDARWHRRKGLPYEASSYVCAGLLTMNLSTLRKADAVKRCFDFLSHHPDPVSSDQTVLNNVCRGKTAILPSGWGLFTHECHGFEGRIKAIHFSGGWPWARCKNVYDALCLACTQEEVGLWRDFESRVLGLPPSVSERPPFAYHLAAQAIRATCRLANRLGVAIPGRASLQELVSAYDGKSQALVCAREELLGDA